MKVGKSNTKSKKKGERQMKKGIKSKYNRNSQVKENKCFNYNNGITLVALVVTIVVLLILAGVTINLVIGKNGLISRAKEAREKTEEAKESEERTTNDISEWIMETANYLPITEETKPYMPSSEFSRVEGTNLNNGLVIQDAEENQYVWVEVPMTKKIYKTTGVNVTEFNEEIYEKIEDDLHEYTMAYRKGKSEDETVFEDKYYNDATVGWFDDEESYNEEKYKMLKSIYQNGGFWVGRYEAGIEDNRTSSNDPINKSPKAKADLYPYNYVTRTQAKKLAEMVQYTKNNVTYKGSLMFGVQWDLLLAFIHNKENIEDSILVTNSTSIGNYRNSTFKINRGRYAVYSEYNLKDWISYIIETENYVDAKANKLQLGSSGNGLLLTTGAVDQNRLMNIYDIAGNVWEMTLEWTKDNDAPYVCRGGSCSYSGSYGYVSRRYSIKDSSNYMFIGFRICLY